MDARRPLAYPPARRDATVDVLHGHEVADPYRWLEDAAAPDTRAWIEAENALTEEVLAGIPGRQELRARLRELWDYERTSVPLREGGRYFFRKNDGLQNQSVLYVADQLEDAPRVLIDPNALAADGTVSLQTYAPSPDGRRLAYALARGGSDWLEWRVLDVQSGADRPDLLRWSKFSGASWTHDSRGFFYSAYPPPAPGAELEGQNYHHRLCYHRLDTPQEQDELVYHRPDQKEWGFSGRVTDDGAYLVITVWKGTDETSLVFYRDLQAPQAPVLPLIDSFRAGYRFIDNDGPLFWFWTDDGAPRGRVVAIDCRAPSDVVEVIPEAKDTLEDADVVGNNFLAVYLRDAHSELRVLELDGRPLRQVKLPGLGTVVSSNGKRVDTETFYSFTGFTHPTAIYRYDVRTDQSTPFFVARVAIDPDDYVTRQVFVPSSGGAQVPLFLVHRRGLRPNGDLPTYLYGYGGFDVSLTPDFSMSRMAWLERGGVYAVACVRGGGEYGEQWHKAGAREHKQNAFDDFIAVAEWLIEQGYTAPRRLAIGGRSNGGLLVAACMAQRPELFGAVHAAVGVMDMLRFHKFTIGWAWTDDYGSPDDPVAFAWLRRYSPLHNLRPGASYPATLITTADHDDRVVPAHSFKFTAALQAAQGGPAPVLIRVDTAAGHGGGTPTEKLLEEVTDEYAFLLRALEMPGGR